jgi:glycosyltransferase involved in cell wall biosynthesis
MFLSNKHQMKEKKNCYKLKGLAVSHISGKSTVGVNRSIIYAQEPLQAHGISLDLLTLKSTRNTVKLLAAISKGHITGDTYDFVTFNGVASLLSRQNKYADLFWFVLCRLNMPKFIYWHESDWVLKRSLTSEELDRLRRKISESQNVIHFTASSACTQSVEKYFPGISCLEIYECSKVDTTVYKPSQPSIPPTVINVASIQERKGTDLFVETAIKVCSCHPTVEFIWLGTGQRFGTWSDKIKQSGFEHRILFPGHINTPHLILRQASLMFLSSRDDPFPLSVLEAMCLARTVVTFDVGGAPEALGEQRISIPCFDTDIAAGKILDLLNKDPSELINQDSMNRYLKVYTPERFAERLNSKIRSHLEK